MRFLAVIFPLLATAYSAVGALAAEQDIVTPPINYLSYSERFASSGQPTAEQLTALKAEGYERIIYIAFSDQERSLPHEDRLVKQLGMTYLHIPVDFGAPLPGEFEAFAAAMALDPQKKTLLHCQVNFRATAFAFLYRVLHEGVPLAEAKAAMNSIWTPDEVWTRFVLDVLRANDVDPYCEGCDWTPAEL